MYSYKAGNKAVVKKYYRTKQPRYDLTKNWRTQNARPLKQGNHKKQSSIQQKHALKEDIQCTK